MRQDYVGKTFSLERALQLGENGKTLIGRIRIGLQATVANSVREK
jgi:hypothetical protein